MHEAKAQRVMEAGSRTKISDAELARVRKLKYLTDENGWKTYPLKPSSRAEMMLHRSVCHMVRHQEHMRVDKIGRVPCDWIFKKLYKNPDALFDCTEKQIMLTLAHNERWVRRSV